MKVLEWLNENRLPVRFGTWTAHDVEVLNKFQVRLGLPAWLCSIVSAGIFLQLTYRIKYGNREGGSVGGVRVYLARSA